jgi:hypothetical protein
MLKTLKVKTLVQGCTLNFQDETKRNINKLLKVVASKQIMQEIQAMILKGLIKLKLAENPNNNDSTLCRNHVAFLIKAYTEGVRSAESTFEAPVAI